MNLRQRAAYIGNRLTSWFGFLPVDQLAYRDIKPVIVVTHAGFSEMRHVALMRLISDLRSYAPTIPFIVAEDKERRGSLWCWRQAMQMGLDAGASHVVWLPDDAIICKDFGTILTACIKARPNDVFDCYVSHPALESHELPTCWYSTSDGYTGMGGCMPADLLREHLVWRDVICPEDYPNDAGVNMWAMMTGRRIFKTAWSLVQHDQELPSLDGHDEQAAEGHVRDGLRPVQGARHGVTEDVMNFLGRTFMAPEEHMPGRSTSCVDIGPTYKSNMFDAVRLLPPEQWNLDLTYKACHPTQEGEHVVIIVPVYHEPEAILRKTRPSREAIVQLLEVNGIACTIHEMPGDSHVDRMRQRATHFALKAGATRLLWSDADIESLDPGCVLAMIRSGHDIVAGACPFKDTTGRVVCNIREEDERVFRGGPGKVDLVDGCLEVQDAGTGFMMVSRKALLTMFQAYPERCHLSRSEQERGEPLWAIWDAAVIGDYGETWEERLSNRVFATEDFHFCRLWQQLGGKVYVYVPAKFRHWGLWGFEASFEKQWGLERAG